MFNSRKTQTKSQATRAQILASALHLFRERGLEVATMRDVAAQAGVAVGAAYYYFESKEAIIQAYYEEVQAEHARRVSETLAAKKLDIRERLRAALHTKLDILQNDRNLMGALFRYTGEPQHPLSALGPHTQKIREQSMVVFAQAVGDERLPGDIRQALPYALWAMHMGILLYFLYDESEGQRRTRKLVDGVVTLLVRVLSLAKLPLMKPVRGSVLTLLREAGLVPEQVSPHELAQKEAQP